MYSKQETSTIRKKFWTLFGQYMRPVRNANEEQINWINYKTGVRNIYFRMDADNKKASISIEITHSADEWRVYYFQKFRELQLLFKEQLGEEWLWEPDHQDEDGQIIGKISKTLPGVNIFNETDWPAIISFLKATIIKLDSFWMNAAPFFEEV